jgi:hypothetical protein
MSNTSRRRLSAVCRALLAGLVGVAISLTVGAAYAAALNPQPEPPGVTGPADAAS